MNEKDFEFTNEMLRILKEQKEKLEYNLRQINIQIESLEDFKLKGVSKND